MESFKEDKASIYKLAQVYKAVCEHYGSSKLLRAIADKPGDLNCAVPNSSYHVSKKTEIIGNTALHFAASEFRDDQFEWLLDSGGDFTMKNRNGMNPLHLAVQARGKYYRVPWDFSSALANPIVDLILAKQLALGITENPGDNNGITHLHAACMTNNAKAVEYLLNNGASVDEAIDSNSPLFSGYTPLHIASKCGNVETAEVLLKYGADIRLRDSKGMTPLHLLLMENLNIDDSQKYEDVWRDERKPIASLERNERIMFLILENCDVEAVRDAGLTPLHVACATRNTTAIETYLLTNRMEVNRVLDENSPFGAGCTALHFAALFNLDAVKLLLKFGTDLTIKDAKGSTALEECLERQKLKSNDIRFILSHNDNLKEALLSDNATKFMDLASAMESLECFVWFLRDHSINANTQVAADSQLWPGCTPLHLAMIFYKRMEIEYTRRESKISLQPIESCFDFGADVTVQDVHGRTPLHRAFQLGRADLIDLLCERHEKSINPVDANGLSHLHIACATKNVSLVKKLLMGNGGLDVDQSIATTIEWPGREEMSTLHSMCRLPSGTTPLHIAVSSGSWGIIEILLEHKANIYAKDVNDMTPMHWILTSTKPNEVKKILSSTDSLRECVSRGGVSLLHIASATNEVKTIERLIDSGVQVDTKVTYKCPTNPEDSLSFLSIYNDFTALHFAMKFSHVDAIKLLVRRRADIIAKYKDRYYGSIVTPLYHTMSTRYCRYDYYRDDFISCLKSDAGLQKRVQDECGLTMLHLACWQADFQNIEKLLKIDGTKVNAQIHLDSPMWQGFTPMNLLMKKASVDIAYNDESQGNIDQSIRLLLDSGVEITLQNGKGDTLIHYAYKRLCNFYRGCNIADSVFRRRLNMLLNRIEDFNVNPVNSQGFSHFHIACLMNNADVINKFLQHRTVDVGRAIDHFGKRLAGYSPLHLALFGKSKQVHGVANQVDIVNTLIAHGAEIDAQDSLGNTPFHSAAESEAPRRQLFQTLLGHGADIFAKNIWGKTPLEVLLEKRNGTIEEFQFFLDNGYTANMFNPISEIGYLTWALRRNENYDGDADDDSDDDRIIKRTSCEAFLRNSTLTRIDEFGRTAIHNIVSEDVAAFNDTNFADIVEKLKSIGCFVDHQDKLGRTALHTAARFRNWNAVAGLLLTGADANVTDTSGKTAFEYLLKHRSELDEDERERDDGKVISMRALFALHIHKLLLCGMDVDPRNKSAMEKAVATKYFYFEVDKINGNFKEHVGKTKVIRIGQSSLLLHDFLSETGAVSAYPHMSEIQKNDAAKFFEVEKRYKLHHELQEVAGLLKLQYGKALARSTLVEEAKDSLLTLVRFSLPELCALIIMRYLSNAQLQCLIESTAETFE